jgi:hypothetical protein
MFNKGGQRRTMETPCGWRCVGHPNEVKGKYNIHKKFCETCKENENTEIPKFSRENGDINGWNGINVKNNHITKVVSTCLTNGRRLDIVNDAKSIHDAVEQLKENDNLLATIASLEEKEIGGDKKKKRRNKKKTKKQEDLLFGVGNELSLQDLEKLISDLEK